MKLAWCIDGVIQNDFKLGGGVLELPAMVRKSDKGRRRGVVTECSDFNNTVFHNHNFYYLLYLLFLYFMSIKNVHMTLHLIVTS